MKGIFCCLAILVMTMGLASSEVHYMYCHTGGTKSLPVTDSEIRNGQVLREFNKYCQCKHEDDCYWNVHHRDFGCSSFVGEYLEDTSGVKAACVIHDICYNTERSKDKCDREFKHNVKQLCTPDVSTWFSASLEVCTNPLIGWIPGVKSLLCPGVIAAAIADGADNCEVLAQAVYLAVRDHGRTHPKTCSAAERNNQGTRCPSK